MPTATALKIDLDRARAHWLEKQGLSQRPGGNSPLDQNLEEVAAASGWLRTLGGVDAYLALRARVPGLDRDTVDAAVRDGSLHVAPAARGCIYLVPRRDLALALSIAEDSSRKRMEKELAKAGVAQRESDDVTAAVLETLTARGPLSTDALRKALPAGTLRGLGEAGKKVGMSSALPAAIRFLEFEGRVERIPEASRLDTERYEWRVPQRSPFDGASLPATAAERSALLARRFVAFAGPATVKDFQCWTVFSQRDARAAFAAAGLAPISVEGWSDEAWILEEEVSALRDASALDSASLLSFEDNYLALHGGPALVTDPRHHAVQVQQWGMGKTVVSIGESRHMQMRTVMVDGLVSGLWEFDPDKGHVVYKTFDALQAARRKQVEALAADVTAFLKDDVGHARSYSLDTVEGIRSRVAAVQNL